jgi:hypothetical protein
VTFTATVSPAPPDGETVTFYNGVSSIGTGTTASGVATLSTSTLPAGSDSITATYAGDTNYATSTSSPLTQTVNQASTTTTLTSLLNPSIAGQAVTFTATVSPTVPDGETVTFYNGVSSIGTGTTSGGQATLTTSSLPSGSDSITATYAGDSNYLTSTSSPLAQKVKIATTTTLTSSLNPSLAGQAVTFTATISPAVPKDEGVNIYYNGNFIGTCFTNNSSVATYTTSSVLPVGSDSITATYVGDANYGTSTSSPLTQVVTKGTTTTTLTASTNSSTYGQPVTLTATVSPTVPNAETVKFYSGATLLGTAFTVSGKATLTTSYIPAGSDSLTATYTGDANYSTSTSSPVAITIAQASTTIVLTSSLNPSHSGNSVTFTATMSPTVGNAEAVRFYNGATLMGTGFTSGGVATFTTSSLSVGSHSITATYVGDANCLPATSSVLTQVVNNPPV